jgi:hypothetical protein
VRDAGPQAGVMLGGGELGLCDGVSALARGSVAAPPAGERRGQFPRCLPASQRPHSKIGDVHPYAQDDLRRPYQQSTSNQDDQSSPVMAPAPRTPPPRNPAAVKATIVAVIAATVDVDRVDLFGHRRVRSIIVTG